MRFRKIPVEIEVEGQVEETKEVETPEGFIEATPGDVIVRGVEGERYPVKPGIFAKTYVPADPEDMDAFRFYHSVTPEGVTVYLEEGTNGPLVSELVHIAGVSVNDPDELGPEAWNRAVEFARELSAVIGLSDPPRLDEEGAEGDA